MLIQMLATIVALTNEFGSVAVDTEGALVLSYVPKGGEEVFFRQSGAKAPGGWYNGGVPVCWPWFNLQGDPGTVAHGFARLKEWTLVTREDGAKASKAVFRLEEAGAYRLDYEVILDASLTLRLSMCNTGKERFVVTTGLHPYFAVSSPDNVTVTTPEGKVLQGRAGMDGGLPFGEGVYDVRDRGNGRRMSLKMFGNTTLILWNCGPDEPMKGMAGDDWNRYLCIEPAVIPRAKGFYLHPGETRSIGLAVSASR